MCHLVLLMPVMGLSAFWLMPMNIAIPSYVAVLLVSALVYWLILDAMKRPERDGFHSLIGTEAEVVSQLEPGGAAQYLVRTNGELWSARSTEVLRPKEKVNIAALDGLRLVVERRSNEK